MKLGSIFHPFTRCCGAPAAPTARSANGRAIDGGKAIDAGKAQSDANVKADDDVKADIDAKADAAKVSAPDSQNTPDPSNAAPPEPRAQQVAVEYEVPVAPPRLPTDVGPAEHASGFDDDDASSGFESAYHPASSDFGDRIIPSNVPHIIVPTIHDGPIDFTNPPKVVILPVSNCDIPPQFTVGQ